MTAREAKKLFNKDIIELPIFNSQIHVFFTREDFNKAMVWRGHEEAYGGTGLAYHSILVNHAIKDEDNSLFMGIFTNKISTIIHEATHIALFFLDIIGHNLTKEDKLLPYLVSYITTETIKLQKKNK